jgi:diguanylate cyclase (GGDEF)-like protein
VSLPPPIALDAHAPPRDDPGEAIARGVAEHAISHLADLTAQRDRELLDVTLAQGVLDLLSTSGLNDVGVYRLLGATDADRHWLCAGLARRGQLVVSDPPWLDLAQLPPAHAHPLRQAALQSRNLTQSTDMDIQGQPTAPCVTVLPLPVEVGYPGVLEISSDLPLGLPALRQLQALLKVFGNFQNLLESSQRDALTGLLNRQTFDTNFLKASMMPAAGGALSVEGDRRGQAGPAHWLAVVDIDFFKRVNDGYGHLIGDEVLVLVARIMRQTFRHYDRLYRFGGEEFVIMLRGGTENDALSALERFRGNVERYPFPQVGQVTVSMGFTEVQRQDSPTEAFSRADQAVYQAKHHGRNRIFSYEALVLGGVIETAERRDGGVELF